MTQCFLRARSGAMATLNNDTDDATYGFYIRVTMSPTELFSIYTCMWNICDFLAYRRQKGKTQEYVYYARLVLRRVLYSK